MKEHKGCFRLSNNFYKNLTEAGLTNTAFATDTMKPEISHVRGSRN